jgi:hypothetical protein
VRIFRRYLYRSSFFQASAVQENEKDERRTRTKYDKEKDKEK